MVTSDYPPDIGGIAAHVAFLSRALVDRRNSVAVAAICEAAPAPGLSEESGVRVWRLAGEVKFGPLSFKLRRVRLRACVRRFLAESAFDVIHIHGHAMEPYAVTPFASRVPVVGTMHSSRFLELMKTADGRERLSRNLRVLAASTGPSRELCETVDALGLSSGPCAYIPNGIDVSRFRPDIDGSAFMRESGLPSGRRIVLCARRIAPKNGILYLARAVPEILRRCPDVLPVFAGSEEHPEYAQEVHGALRVAGMEDRCVFLGSVPNDRMPELMRLASVSVLPSLLEATSITGLESMACGVPLVGTNVGGIPELISDGETGVIVPPRDPAALADGVCRVLEDGEFATRVSSAARLRAVEQFGWDRIAERMEAVYASAMERHSKVRK